MAPDKKQSQTTKRRPQRRGQNAGKPRTGKRLARPGRRPGAGAGASGPNAISIAGSKRKAGDDAHQSDAESVPDIDPALTAAWDPSSEPARPARPARPAALAGSGAVRHNVEDELDGNLDLGSDAGFGSDRGNDNGVGDDDGEGDGGMAAARPASPPKKTTSSKQQKKAAKVKEADSSQPAKRAKRAALTLKDCGVEYQDQSDLAAEGDGAFPSAVRRVFGQDLAAIAKPKPSLQMLIVCSSAERTLEIIKHLKTLTGVRVAKLFARHIKLEEQIQQLNTHAFSIGVGTPHRISKLLLDESELIIK
ncbi:cms1 ribosomal small subunit [Polyrhizophydium stewartii]|uniref:Cms1 ribosomal small subunit n=1 Tax=Polyrhizophydium stewartii TaxID=2732419 RepID=A0ABR4N4I8_9FUNG